MISVDDWCGCCGTQMEELLPCKRCGDMFCLDCLNDGYCEECAAVLDFVEVEEVIECPK